MGARKVQARVSVPEKYKYKVTEGGFWGWGVYFGGDFCPKLAFCARAVFLFVWAFIYSSMGAFFFYIFFVDVVAFSSIVAGMTWMTWMKREGGRRRGQRKNMSRIHCLHTTWNDMN